MKPYEHYLQDNERHRIRYASDEAYRERKRRYSIERYHRLHPEAVYYDDVNRSEFTKEVLRRRKDGYVILDSLMNHYNDDPSSPDTILESRINTMP